MFRTPRRCAGRCAHSVARRARDCADAPSPQARADALRDAGAGDDGARARAVGVRRLPPARTSRPSTRASRCVASTRRRTSSLVAIDPRTLTRLDRFPFSRVHHARVIRRLRQGGREGHRLRRPVHRADDDGAPTTRSSRRSTRRRGSCSARARSVRAGRPTSSAATTSLRAIGARVGSVNIPNDPSGVIRRLAYDESGLPAFAGRRGAARRRPAARHARGLRRPTAAAWIDYPGPPGTIRTVSFVDVERGPRRPGAGARQGRRRRRDRAVAEGHLPGRDVRRPGHVGRRDPGGLDPDGARRPAAAQHARLARRPADRRARAARRRHDAALGPAARGARSASSPPSRSPASRSSRSTRAGSSSVLYPLLALGLGLRRRARRRDDARRLRARARARPVRALRARGGRRRRPRAHRRRPAPRRRAQGRDGHVLRHPRLHGVLRASRAGGGHRGPQRVPDDHERGHPRARRHAHRLHGRRDHGRLRRPGRAWATTPTARSTPPSRWPGRRSSASTPSCAPAETSPSASASA